MEVTMKKALGKSKKPLPHNNNSMDGLPKGPMFYFGSVIFFIGFLLIALAVSRLATLALDLMTLAELISGTLLVIVGVRAIHSATQ